MSTTVRRSVLRAAIPWLLILLSACWVAFHATPRTVRAEYGLVPAVDRFSYENWHTDLELVRDTDGRAELTITETIVARFPDHDQNKGIVRGIPVRSSLALDDVRVTGADGDDVAHSTEFDEAAEMVYILTGTDDYVHGTQTYVIEYTITEGLFREPGGGALQFYWNLLPLDSAQPIENFSATVRIASEVSASLTGGTVCYQGRYGSTDTCELDRRVEDDGTVVFEYGSGYRKPGDGVTVGVDIDRDAFESPDLFPRHEPSSAQLLFGHLATWQVGVGLFVAAIALVAAAEAMRARFVARTRREPPANAAPKSEVPSDLPPPVAAATLRAAGVVVAKPGGVAAAQIAHLAVRKVIRFESDSDGNGAVRVRLLDPSRAVHDLDRRTMALLFPDLKVDTVAEIPRKSAAFGEAMMKIVDDGQSAARAQGRLRRGSTGIVPLALGIIGVGLCLTGLALLGASFAWGTAGTWEGLAFAGGIIAFVITIATGWSIFRPPPVPTDEGRAACEHLLGVREYMKQRRKSSMDWNDIDALELLLPYAVVFTMDRQWQKTLKIGYSAVGVDPAWLSGTVGDLSSRWASILKTTRASSTYIPPSSSSGGGGGGYSGGGGGFSGGGGGGGFSGGR